MAAIINTQNLTLVGTQQQVQAFLDHNQQGGAVVFNVDNLVIFYIDAATPPEQIAAAMAAGGATGGVA